MSKFNAISTTRGLSKFFQIRVTGKFTITLFGATVLSRDFDVKFPPDHA